MMDKLHKTFVDATHKVFKLMLQISEISERPAEDLEYDDAVDIAIGVVGDLHGEVIYRFPVSTSLKMVNIMSGMQFEEVDAFVTSAISEIANIISGNVLTILSDNNDMKCDILPPVQRNVDGSQDEDGEYEIRTSSCISTTIGDMCLEVKLNRAS